MYVFVAIKSQCRHFSFPLFYTQGECLAEKPDVVGGAKWRRSGRGHWRSRGGENVIRGCVYSQRVCLVLQRRSLFSKEVQSNDFLCTTELAMTSAFFPALTRFALEKQYTMIRTTAERNLARQGTQTVKASTTVDTSLFTL